MNVLLNSFHLNGHTLGGDMLDYFLWSTLSDPYKTELYELLIIILIITCLGNCGTNLTETGEGMEEHVKTPSHLS